MFYSNPIQFSRNLTTPNIDDTFRSIINFFVQDHKALLNISDIKSINLYDGLKDLDHQDEVFTNLLQKIHQEAPNRYNYNRIGDSDMNYLVHAVLNKLAIELENHYPNDSDHKNTIATIKDIDILS